MVDLFSANKDDPAGVPWYLSWEEKKKRESSGAGAPDRVDTVKARATYRLNDKDQW